MIRGVVTPFDNVDGTAAIVLIVSDDGDIVSPLVVSSGFIEQRSYGMFCSVEANCDADSM